MARPREFDETVVLDRALDVFWRKGFDGASIEDLTTATGLSRASLYGAFTDKEGLFKAALVSYQRAYEAAVPPLAEASSALQWIAEFMQVAVTRACDGPTGCFVQLSLGQCDARRAEAQTLLRESATATRALLTAAVTQAVAQHELQPTTPTEVVANYLTVVLSGIAAAARAGQTREQLQGVVAEALQSLQRYV